MSEEQKEYTPNINFIELSKIDVSRHIEKKGKLSYLSWPLMVGYLRQHMPSATIQARKFGEGCPYILTPEGGMVETYIVQQGVELWSEWLPVMDHRNKAIKKPDMFEINKAIQRCKAKCISEYLGIGLYIYKGEDLPEAGPPETITSEQSKHLVELAAEVGADYKKFCKFFNIEDSDDLPASMHKKAISMLEAKRAANADN